MTLDDFALSVLGEHTDRTAFAEQSFIGLGGDSLRALRLAALAQEQLGLRIPVAALLDAIPLAEVLAQALPVSGNDTDTGPAPAAESMTHAQRGMWLIERVTGGSPYNLVFTCVVEDGTLDPAGFDQAVAATVARHDGLRTVYREGDGAGADVVPEVLDPYRPEIAHVEYDGDPAGFAEFVRATAAEHGARSFDLTAAPAYRFLRITGTGGGHAVVLLAHHIVLDGWAVGLFLTEIFAHYAAIAGGTTDAPTGHAVTPQVLAEHQHAARTTGEWDEQAEFWRKQLDGVPTVLELPADRQRPAVQDAAGARTPVDLGVPVTNAVLVRARALGITPFALLLGAYALTLSRWTGARSLLVGVPLTGRGTAELARLIAVAGNLVPIRVDVHDDAPVGQYLRSVHQSLAQGIEAGSLPFEELVSRLGVGRTLGCHPLVQVSFGMHDQLVPQRIQTTGATVRVEEGHGGGAQFDLSLLIGRSDPALAGHLEFATGVWTAEEAAGFLADFQAAVEQLSGAAVELPGGVDIPLVEVRCLAPERRTRLERINRTRDDFPSAALETLFAETVRRDPGAVAVREGDTELTYRELAGAAAEQARLLRAAGVRPGDRVLIGLDRSVAEAVAVLGVVLAGAAYVGVDLDLPTAHLEKIVGRAAPVAALVPAGKAEPLVAQGIPVVPSWAPGWAADTPEMAPDDPERLAYVAFTSGSTGQPKGVCVPHRAVVRLVHEPDYVRIGPGDRVLRFSPLAFDASTLELWGALLNGATLEVHPAGLPTPTELGRFLTERGVTVAWLTAGLFRLMAEFAPDGFAGLRQLLTGGDVVPHEHAARMLERHPGLTLTNGYGPTENTTFTATHSVRDAAEIDGPLPIGTPLPGTTVYVLDERGRRVPPGAVGELYAGGAGLATGYLGDDAETARCFGHFSPETGERLYRTGDMVRLDTQGRLRFLGRRDDQVKLRGYRVELSAISDALRTHADVQDAVVTVSDGDSADKRLVAAVVPEPGAELDTVRLRDHLGERLPTYMVPVLWAVVERVPITANGKVDRRALVTLAGPAGPATGARPKASPEDLLVRVSALFVEAIAGAVDAEIGADTDFFTVGGNSMGAVRLMRLVKDRLGPTLKLRDFLITPTPAGLRRLVEQAS